MAIAINASLSKKIPLQGHQFASQQVSITITGEVTDLARVPEEAARLLGLAEASVDQKLGLTKASSAAPASVTTPGPTTSQPHTPALPSQTTYPSSGGRHAPAGISAAQLRFLRQLLDRTPGAIDRILAEHRIASIEALSSRAASSVIDQLKAAVP